MTDIVDKATRSRMMSNIRCKNTKPELIVRKYLHAAGFRYRLHVKDLPGKPDIVLPKYNTVIFIHGCFWHGHQCLLFKWPSTNVEFWLKKIERNRFLDNQSLVALQEKGWNVQIIWECEIRKLKKLGTTERLDKLVTKLKDTKARS